MMIELGTISEIEGEFFRYHVGSRRHGKQAYLVDLEEYDWNGACGCYDFEFRMRPLLERGAVPERRLRCWHIERARDHAVRSVFPAVARALCEQKQKTKNEKQYDKTSNVDKGFSKPTAR